MKALYVHEAALNWLRPLVHCLSRLARVLQSLSHCYPALDIEDAGDWTRNLLHVKLFHWATGPPQLYMEDKLIHALSCSPTQPKISKKYLEMGTKHKTRLPSSTVVVYLHKWSDIKYHWGRLESIVTRDYIINKKEKSNIQAQNGKEGNLIWKHITFLPPNSATHF